MKRLTQQICRLFAITAALAATLPTASAGGTGSIYDNGAPDHVSANNLGFAWQADDFSLSAGASISGINFWSLEAAGAYRGSISWSIVGDKGGKPTGTVLASATESGVNRSKLGTSLGLDEFFNTFSFGTPLTLGPGTYWLVLHNGPFGNLDDPNEFLWETSAANYTMGGMESFDGGASWTGNFNEHAFQVSAVPEPASVLLLTTGMLMVGALRRREQRRGLAR
jgi:hypothetical protein